MRGQLQGRQSRREVGEDTIHTSIDEPLHEDRIVDRQDVDEAAGCVRGVDKIPIWKQRPLRTGSGRNPVGPEAVRSFRDLSEVIVDSKRVGVAPIDR